MINQLLKPVGTLHIIFLTIFNIHKIKKIYGVRQMRSAHAVGCGRVVHVSRTRSRSVECNLTMKAWKVAGALQRPKGITVHSKSPNGMTNATFSLSSGAKRMCQNPFSRSRKQ